MEQLYTKLIFAMFLVCAADRANGIEPSFTISSTVTYGLFGPPRPAKAIAGEKLIVKTKASGLTTDSMGRIKYSSNLKLLEESGTVLAEVKGSDNFLRLPLGGDSLVDIMYFTIPRELKGGEYALKIEGSDGIGRTTQRTLITLAVEQQSAFGASNLRLAHDKSDAQPASAVFGIGQSISILFTLGGQQLNDNAMNVYGQLDILGEKRENLGLSGLKFPIELENPPNPLPINFGFQAHRSGRYVLRLRLEDRNAKRTVEYFMPIAVVDLADLTIDRAAED